MELITILLLLGPGILMWKVEGDCDLSTRESMVRLILKMIFYNMVILMCSYGVLTAIYGYMAVNLSSTYIEGVGNSIFNISFVWKYGLLSCVFAVIFGVVLRVFAKWKTKKG